MPALLGLGGAVCSQGRPSGCSHRPRVARVCLPPPPQLVGIPRLVAHHRGLSSLGNCRFHLISFVFVLIPSAPFALGEKPKARRGCKGARGVQRWAGGSAAALGGAVCLWTPQRLPGLLCALSGWPGHVSARQAFRTWAKRAGSSLCAGRETEPAGSRACPGSRAGPGPQLLVQTFLL